MKKPSILQSIPVLAQLMSRDGGYQVVMQGDRAYTDGDVMVLPAISEDVDVDRAMTLIRGYHDHEMGHKLYTDFYDSSSYISPLHKELVNILEDVRIESKMANQYPGSKLNLKKLSQVLDKSYRVSEDANIYTVFSNYLMLQLQQDVLDYQFDHLDLLSQKFIELFSSGLRHRLLAMAYPIEYATSTNDAVSIATQLLQLLEDEIKDTESENQSIQEPSDTSEKHVNDKESQPDTGKQPSNGNVDLDVPQELQQLFDADTESFSETLINQDRVEEALSEIATSGSSEFRWRMPKAELMPKGSTNYRSQVQRELGALQTHLFRYLESFRYSDTYYAHNGNTLATERLAYLPLGDTRLYEHEDISVDLNTAIHIVIDHSSSMRNANRIVCANQSSLAMSLVLEGDDNISVAVSAFPSSDSDEGEVSVIKPRTARTENEVLRFDSPAMGSTPMADGLWYAINEIAMASEHRKIIIVITDGKPNSGQRQESRDLIKRAEHEGIEIFGIGIGEMTDTKLFSKYQVISEINELPQSLFQLLERQLKNVAA